MIDFLSLFVHCALRLIVSHPVYNFFALFVEKIDFFHSLLRFYLLLQLVAFEPQLIAFIQLEQLSKGSEYFIYIIEASTRLQTIEKVSNWYFSQNEG